MKRVGVARAMHSDCEEALFIDVDFFPNLEYGRSPGRYQPRKVAAASPEVPGVRKVNVTVEFTTRSEASKFFLALSTGRICRGPMRLRLVVFTFASGNKPVIPRPRLVKSVKNGEHHEARHDQLECR